MTSDIEKPPTGLNGEAMTDQPKQEKGRSGLGPRGFERFLALGLLIGALICGFATFGSITGNLPLRLDDQAIILLLYADLAFLLGLTALVVRRFVVLWIARKRGQAGARLHSRVVTLFSFIAVTPTVVVMAFSVLLFDIGLKGWFSERVSTAVTESLEVAEAYLEEHQHGIRADALAMAQDLDRQGAPLAYNPQRLNQVLGGQMVLRSLTEASIIDSANRVWTRVGYTFMADLDPQIPELAFARARGGEVVILPAVTRDRVRALVALEFLPDSFLYVGRFIDPQVLNHLDRTRGAVELYEEIEGRGSDLQITFALIFAVVALMMLFVAVWFGLIFATRLTGPISDLIGAAEKVGGGDLSARVKVEKDGGEITGLSDAFNRMTARLGTQQQELLEANDELDLRRRFIEAVLSGVSAGVIGLDAAGRITLPNRSAGELLAKAPDELKQRPLVDFMPEVAGLLDDARNRPWRLSEDTLVLEREGQEPRTLFVRIAAEAGEDGKLVGFVATFDDITELMNAQRKSAWADIARRIAHEIKNPLTPIQLSAERLQRRYLKEIQSDPETFRLLVDTITRHVGEIGRMVSEFSSFARMPQPVMEEVDLCKLVQQASFAQKTANAKIDYQVDLPDVPCNWACDASQIDRALTNILKNAAEAIEGRPKKSGVTLPKGVIHVKLLVKAGRAEVQVSDNGRGLPKQERSRLTEPYVTTRAKGTGLGLAIVKKIMEEHGGDLLLDDGPMGGAMVRLVFSHGEPEAKPQAAKKDVKAHA